MFTAPAIWQSAPYGARMGATAAGRHSPCGLSRGACDMKRDHFGRPQDVTATQPISHDVLKEKYLKPGENGLEDLYRRVARALASVEPEAERARHEALFLENLHDGAIGAGRIMIAARTAIQATPINSLLRPVGDFMPGGGARGSAATFKRLRG